MKEKLYTIPLNDAMDAQDECPFCHIERTIEQDLLDFILGSSSSYMESHIRELTDQAGFCRNHFKKMYDYGNTLGNGWILKTHYMQMIEELSKQLCSVTKNTPSPKGLLKKRSGSNNPILSWSQAKEKSCYICNQFNSTYDRYLDTFFVMYKRDEEFRHKVKNSKGFCLPHFGDLCAKADEALNEKERGPFYDMVAPLMIENMTRVKDDITWLVDKFDYRNQDADWKNSKDALQRGMQKLKGSYPADPIYKMNK